MKKSYLFITALAVILLFTATPVYAETISVNSEDSLLAAVNTAHSGDVIFVTKNITLHERIYIVNKNLTIQGADPSITVQRGSEFKTENDIRGNFNPVMLEVAVYPVSNPDLRSKVILKNITFNDTPAGDFSSNTGGTVKTMSLAPSGGSAEYSADWQERLPDSILAAYDTKTTIILDKGAQLKNPMSNASIMITNGANCIIEEGSLIETGSAFNRDIILMWNSANLTLNTTLDGIKAKNVVHAVNHGSEYKVHFNGQILNADVTNVISATGNGEINFNGTVSGSNKISNIVSASNSLVNFRGSVSHADTITSVIYGSGNSQINFYGNISDSNLTHTIHIMGSTATLHQNSIISNNTNISAGTVYAQYNSVLNVYGNILNNTCVGNNGGAIYIIHNSTGMMYDSANISGNIVKSSSGGGSGGGIYINHNTTFTMNGGTISNNKAEGAYSSLKSSGDYGGGGVSVIRSSQFIMNGGTVENNSAAAGGGVWVSGKAETGKSAPVFVFNSGTIKNNSITDAGNSTYGSDVALAACGGASSPSSESTGHYVLVGENAVIGNGLIGVAQSSSQTAITGYHQAVYLNNKNNSDLRLGTLKTDLETAIVNNVSIASEVSGYTNTNSSLWLTTQKTSGNVSIVSALSDPNVELNENEYKFIVAALDSSLTVQSLEVYRPSRTSDGLLLEIPVFSGASSYGIIILKEIKTDSLTLTISHEGDGEFYFVSNPSDTVVTLISGPPDTVEIFAKAGTGRYIKSIKLTAGDGSIFEKTAVNGLVEVNYYDLAAGNNNIHAVFAVSTGGSGPGTGSATVNNGTGSESAGFEEPVSPNKPEEPIPGNAALVVPTLIILFFVLAVAVFVFVYKRNEEKEEK